nr:hypothetical protein [Tanacetum cinerariifolium]
MSLIHGFPFEELYTHDFSDSFQQTTGPREELPREDSFVEAVATSPLKTKKPTRERQNRTIQSDDAPRQSVWTHEEEIALSKGWVDVFQNSMLGNSRKEVGFWCAILAYMESKTKQCGRRTYDMVNGKWKMVRPAVVRLCGVYGNVMRRGDKAKDAPKKKGSRGSRASRSSNTNDEALARLMVTETTTHEKEQRKLFLKIKRKEVKCREREARNQEYRQRQDDIRFYLQPYDHLTVDARLAMEELRAEIKAKYDLPY